jgi:hypothetical protein
MCHKRRDEFFFCCMYMITIPNGARAMGTILVIPDVRRATRRASSSNVSNDVYVYRPVEVNYDSSRF